MKHDHDNAPAHSRLMKAAKARVHQLRTQAITYFWNEAGQALRRALKVATRFMHGRERPAQPSRQGV